MRAGRGAGHHELMSARTEAEIAAMLERGEERGSVEVSELEELTETLELDEAEVERIYEELEAHGIDVHDDCARSQVAPTRIGNGDLATATVDAFQLFMNEIGRYPLLTARQEVELAKRIERGDKAAKDLMVNSNLRLVVSIARRYWSPSQPDPPLLDLVQEGILGLIRAVEKFDWRRGFKFSTYATWWIRQAIQRGIVNRGRTIRIPVHVADRERKLARAQRELTARLGRAPGDAELVEAAGLTLEQLEEVRAAARAVTSLDRPVGDGEASLAELIVAEGEGPAEEVGITLAEEALRRAVAELPELEREVVSLRYGVGNGGPHTIEHIARSLRISRERVRALEAEALKHLAVERELLALRDAA